MKWSESGSQDFENPAPGTYVATCYKILDVGTQDGEYEGKATKRRQCIIGWELSELMADGRPFVVTKFYTASLNESSKLRKDLASWRGRDFTADELQGFESKNILGKACLLSLVENDKGKIRVANVSKIAKGMAAPPLVNPMQSLDLESFDPAVFESLSEGIKSIIAKSPEYKAATSKKAPASTPAPAESFPSDDSDIPDF